MVVRYSGFLAVGDANCRWKTGKLAFERVGKPGVVRRRGLRWRISPIFDVASRGRFRRWRDFKVNGFARDQSPPGLSAGKPGEHETRPCRAERRMPASAVAGSGADGYRRLSSLPLGFSRGCCG